MSPQVEACARLDRPEEWQSDRWVLARASASRRSRSGRRAERRTSNDDEGAVHNRVPHAAQARATRCGSTTRQCWSLDDRRRTPLFWQGVLLDITAQKEAQRGLAEAEERYRALIEHIPAVVYRESPEGDPREVLHQPAGARSLRLHARGVDVDARLLAQRHPSRRPGARLRGRRPIERDEGGLHPRLPVPARRRSLGLGARRGDLRARARRRGLLAGLPARHHRAQASRGSGFARPSSSSARSSSRTRRSSTPRRSTPTIRRSRSRRTSPPATPT